MKKGFLTYLKSDLNFYGGKNIKSKIGVILFNKNFKVLLSYRIMYFLNKTKFSFINIWLTYHQQVKYGCHISAAAELGVKIKFAHAFGVLIGAARIEDGVTIFQQVTIGSHGVQGQEMAWPIIKQGVTIYSGAKILGGIEIGEEAQIGANVVVNRDIPAKAIVNGPSAKIVGYIS
jgi:serine O-acetyltransferase